MSEVKWWTHRQEENEAAEWEVKQQDRFSRQPPSEATIPSGIFGLIEEPGTINQTDKHAVRVAAGGDVPVQEGGGLINLRWVRWPPVQAGEYGGELMDGWMMEQDSGDGGLAIWPFSPVWMAEWTGASRWGHFLRPHVGPADCWSQDSREFDLSILENNESDPVSICRTADSRPDSGITLCVRLQFQFQHK